MFTKPPFIPMFFGILLLPLVLWIVITPASIMKPCPCPVQAVTHPALVTDELGRVPPNRRLKLAAPVVCGTISFVKTKARRRSLGAPR
jgi:hypothetical protein